MQRILLLLFLLVTGLSTRTLAQQRPCPMKGDSGSAMGGMGSMGNMGMMMDHAMMARMDSLDARLDSLTKVMTAATGTRKLNAMSAVLSDLVAHHLDMRRMMHEHMMGQMGMAEMPGMSRSSGMMPMDGAGCSPAAKPDSTGSRDAPHDH